jgi:hypothetical protein
MLQRPPARSDDRRAWQVRDARCRTRERRRPLDVVRELWPNDNEAALVTKAAVSLSTTSITALAPTALADFINKLRGQIARRAVDVELQAGAKRHRILRNQRLRRFHPDAWAVHKARIVPAIELAPAGEFSSLVTHAPRRREAQPGVAGSLRPPS